MPSKVKCVHCGTDVFEFVNECPNCGKPVANKWAPTNLSASPASWKKTDSKKKSPVPFLVAGIALIAIAVAAFFLTR